MPLILIVFFLWVFFLVSGTFFVLTVTEWTYSGCFYGEIKEENTMWLLMYKDSWHPLKEV